MKRSSSVRGPFGRGQRVRALAAVAASGLVLSLASCNSSDTPSDVSFTAGAAGIGDPYYPKHGNGGYEVGAYDLDLGYVPATGVLTGAATLTATATQNLSAFNLDFVGLEVRSIEVNSKSATWTRADGELTVTPPAGLTTGKQFVTTVRYDGVPGDPKAKQPQGFITLPGGAIAAGQPDGASTWFPVNSHPLDPATFTVSLTVPRGLAAVSNGVLTKREDVGESTIWTWRTEKPMASYLATLAIGDFDVLSYTKDGRPFWDAVEKRLAQRLAPHRGERMARTGPGNTSFQRLTRTLSVPGKGGTLSFFIQRQSEPQWDFAFVEARTAGGTDWTTLRDRNGHTTKSTGNSCPYWLDLHPFLKHYQSPKKEKCAPTGTSGQWWAAAGLGDGYEEWSVDLSRWAGHEVEISISYAGDDLYSLPGAAVDDIEFSTGEGNTSFERDGNVLDGWRVGSPPEGSPGKSARWLTGDANAAPPALDTIVRKSLSRQGEYLAFLEGLFGKYPFETAGAIVHSAAVGFALETQTRPIYAFSNFGDQESGNSVMVHELAHQWVGDDLALAGWRNIWLNEGFASYAEWLWSEHDKIRTADKEFARAWKKNAKDKKFWKTRIGDPGKKKLFDSAVYNRGAMTLHQLRKVVGDEPFFRILHSWTETRAGTHVTIEDFIAHAESISGRDLGEFFNVWLFTPKRP
ncbi:MAG TPA: M1 family metallopeptidase, partial [Sporichthya sp.]|nr:M1 family metallopeptidase [Sporichthya sp.]